MILLDIKDLRKAKITLALIFINILCFLSFNIAMPMEYFYLFVQINSRILNEYEIWRLFTSLF
ncbi:MAG: hypothetical protein ACXAAI_14935, partial [Promethearchaeota archaeon]